MYDYSANGRILNFADNLSVVQRSVADSDANVRYNDGFLVLVKMCNDL